MKRKRLGDITQTVAAPSNVWASGICRAHESCISYQSKALSNDQVLESPGIVKSGTLPTNVTYEQEQAAAKAVGAWMRGNLNAAKTAWQFDNGLRPPTPGPGRAYV